MKSLKDQFLKAGLTDKQSVKDARKQKKQPQKPKSARGESSRSAKLAEQTLRDKAVKDKQLNQQRQLETEKKAQLAQIKQLVASSLIDRTDGELAYNFTSAGKVKKIYVTEDQQKQLSMNQIAIICLATDTFELVPNKVAEKIAQRDASFVIVSDDAEQDIQGDDPYADYQIPDDLIW